MKGRKTVLDIEDCPIATDAVRKGLAATRRYVSENLSKYKRGATLLLRESTIRTPKNEPLNHKMEVADDSQPRLKDKSSITSEYCEQKICITDSKAMSTEWIGDYRFD